MASQKRDLSPSRKEIQNSKKRFHFSSPEPIVIDSDSEDDDLTEILAQIKQQEASEKLAKQLQDQVAPGGSSSTTKLIEDDPDEAFARQLASEWAEFDAVEQKSVPENNSERPEMQRAYSLRPAAEEKTPTESLSQYRAIFTTGRPCTKCGKTVESPRGYVMLSRETISPSLGFLLHAPCPSCKTNHCRGCFKPYPCAATCKGIYKNSACLVDTCCAEVRAIALFEALGGFDRQYIGEKTVSHIRATAIVNDSKKSGTSASVGPGGTGYGVDNRGYSIGYGGYGPGSKHGQVNLRGAFAETDREAARSKDLAAHWEVLVTRALQMLTALLPSPYAESPQVYDLLPHPSVGHLLSSSQLPDLLGDLLRNDSVTDWIARSDVYYAMLALLKRMADSELTVSVLLKSRFVIDKGPGIEQWMWEEGEIEWERGTGGEFEHAPPLYEYFKKLSKQSEAFIAGASQLMETEEDPEETIRGISLCGDIIAARDDIERTISILGVAFDDEQEKEEDKTASKGKRKNDLAELDHAYILASDRLAFRYVSLHNSDSNSKGKDKGKATGLQYSAFNYSSAVTSTQSGTRNPKDRLHLVKELAVLATSLPPGIWVRVDDVRNDVIKIMIAGPEGTPYSNGLWEFDCFMPLAYPAVPPQMHLKTTGGGTVRFNPNLYNNGKVCLSLLGTWPGRPEEQWLPYKSTLLQVLVSIQSMIFIDLPYFNEPGFGRANAHLPASIEYNRIISLQTTRWAIIDWLREEHRNGIWGEVIASHFSIRKEKIRKQIREWAKQNPSMRAYNAGNDWHSTGIIDLNQGISLSVPRPPATSHGMDLVEEFDERILVVQKWTWADEGS